MTFLPKASLADYGVYSVNKNINIRWHGNKNYSSGG